MPVADTQKATGYISCHYLADDYPRVLDILRNEKPVFVEFEIRAGNVANIRTSAEPVGDGEVSHALEGFCTKMSESHPRQWVEA